MYYKLVLCTSNFFCVHHTNKTLKVTGMCKDRNYNIQNKFTEKVFIKPIYSTQDFYRDGI